MPVKNHERIFTGDESLRDLEEWRNQSKFAIGSVYGLVFDPNALEFNVYFDPQKSCWCVEDTVTKLVTNDLEVMRPTLPPASNVIKLHADNLDRELILSYGQSLPHQIELRESLYEASNWYEHKEWLWRSAREDALFLGRHEVLEKSFLSYYDFFDENPSWFGAIMGEASVAYKGMSPSYVESEAQRAAKNSGEDWDTLKEWQKIAWRLNTRSMIIQDDGAKALDFAKSRLAILGRVPDWVRQDADIVASCLLHDSMSWLESGKKDNPYANGS